MKGLGERLVRLRGYDSQEVWADRHHVSQATVSAWENEKWDPPLEFLLAYAEERRVALSWLLTGVATSAGQEGGGKYGIDPEIMRVAVELQRRPILLAVVRKALSTDDTFSRAAKEVALTLGIPQEDAYLKLLEMKGEAT